MENLENLAFNPVENPEARKNHQISLRPFWSLWYGPSRVWKRQEAVKSLFYPFREIPSR